MIYFRFNPSSALFFSDCELGIVNYEENNQPKYCLGVIDPAENIVFPLVMSNNRDILRHVLDAILDSIDEHRPPHGDINLTKLLRLKKFADKIAAFPKSSMTINYGTDDDVGALKICVEQQESQWDCHA